MCGNCVSCLTATIELTPAVNLVRKPRGGAGRGLVNVFSLLWSLWKLSFYFFLITEYVNITPSVARVRRDRLDSLDASVHMNIRTGAEHAWITRKALNRLRTKVGR